MSKTAGVGESASAVTQPIPVVATERCAQCAAPLAHDQRYCLQCGEPRPHLSGPPSLAKSAAETPPRTPPVPPGHSSSASPVATRNNSLALIAGVGVLLLAMGVGVLIGRAGAGSPKAPPAQVISLGGGVVGANGATTTPTTSTPTTETSTTGTPAASSKSKEAKAKESSGTGSSITKPAPSSVLKSAHSHESRQSFEQKSKSLPNVVSTG